MNLFPLRGRDAAAVWARFGSRDAMVMPSLVGGTCATVKTLSYGLGRGGM